MTSRFYQYCKSNIKQKKIQEVSIKTAFTFLAEGKHIVSFVGAGGKSSLIDATAKWSSSQGKKVLVTTTTHIFRPQDEFLAMFSYHFPPRPVKNPGYYPSPTRIVYSKTAKEQGRINQK